MEIKELPFVVGVLGDFTGQPTEPLKALKERKFIEINPDNFDKVLEGMKPHLAFSVANKLSNDPNAGNLKVNLEFKEMADFEPEQIVRQVAPLKDLLTLRTKLSDLRGSLQGNDELDKMLLDIVNNNETRGRLEEDLNKDKGGSNG
jgi:type VI secretion system protein ImpB